ncbi:S-layer homology domain-containing protein [Candidatus Peregrinibacteria bacterium]|nr:S-layer homology domain-containing protein [Candidatus Peregrinibacteria bacterium]
MNRLLFCIIFLALNTPASADSGETLHGAATLTTIIIEQKSPRDIYGEWTLIHPNNTREKSSQPLRNLANVAPGMFTIIAKPPDGAIAKILLEKDGDLPETNDRPQASFSLEQGESMRATIEYTFTRTGIVAVHSDPSDVEFDLSGPNDTSYSGLTPVSYSDMPEGQYSVQFKSIKGCVTPPRKSLLLQQDSRISLSVTFACDEADRVREKQQKEQSGGETHVTVTSEEGTALVFNDVPQITWFAYSVYTVARLGIMSGYRDLDGNLTGNYGPGNFVTIAELAKIAHKIASIEPSTSRRPLNSRARDQWFSPYVASAEQLGWTIFIDTDIDPGRPATRGEVLVTLLQTLDIPLRWQKGDVFEDVQPRTPYAGAIETAAHDEIVSGHTDEFGMPLRTFGPQDPVNRAEMAKILSKILEIYKGQDL